MSYLMITVIMINNLNKHKHFLNYKHKLNIKKEVSYLLEFIIILSQNRIVKLKS